MLDTGLGCLSLALGCRESLAPCQARGDGEVATVLRALDRMDAVRILPMAFLAVSGTGKSPCVAIGMGRICHWHET